MKVILLQDIRGKGKKGQCIEASDGYARNYLLPRKLAVEATADNLNTMRMNDKAAAEKAAKERAEAMEISKKAQVPHGHRVGPRAAAPGGCSAPLHPPKFADALKAQHGIAIDKRKIVLEEPIKNAGTYTLKCKLGYEITGELTAKIVEA